MQLLNPYFVHHFYILLHVRQTSELNYNAGMRLRCGLSEKNYIARHCSVQFSHDNVLAACILSHLFFFLMYKCSKTFGAMKHMLLRIYSIATILKSQLLALMDCLFLKQKVVEFHFLCRFPIIEGSTIFMQYLWNAVFVKTGFTTTTCQSVVKSIEREPWLYLPECTLPSTMHMVQWNEAIPIFPTKFWVYTGTPL